MYYQGHVEAVAFDVIGYEPENGGERLVATFHNTRSQYIDLGLSISKNELKTFFLIINYDGVVGFETIRRELQQSKEMNHLKKKVMIIDYSNINPMIETKEGPFMNFLIKSTETKGSSMLVLFCCKGSIHSQIVEDYANTLTILRTINTMFDGHVTFLPHLLEDVSLQIYGVTNPIRLTAPKKLEKELTN